MVFRVDVKFKRIPYALENLDGKMIVMVSLKTQVQVALQKSMDKERR